MVRHKIKFQYSGETDDQSITLAFSKKAVDQRKEWLTDWMEEGKRRKELSLPEVYLYEKDTRSVNYKNWFCSATWITRGPSPAWWTALSLGRER